MLNHNGLTWVVGLAVLLTFLLIRHVRCTGPYKLSRVLPWRLARRPVVIWRERLFFGWSRSWLGFSRFAFGGEEDSVAVIGPPRVGKTAGVLVPQLAMFDGPAVVTSTKGDALRETRGRREELARMHGGTVHVYAPASNGPVEGLLPIRWSPLAGCEDPLVAALRAATLVSVAEVGKNVENADHWRSGAERILRAYFWAAAAHPEQPGDFTLVKRWLSLHEFEEPVAILLHLGTDGAKEWADELIGIAQRTNDKERASFFAAAQTAVKATGIPAVLRSCRGTDIDPAEFIRTRSTLYIVSPSQHQASLAPLISALIDSIVVTAYALHGARRPPGPGHELRRLVETGRRFISGNEPAGPEPGCDRPARLLLQLDELTNIAPLPTLESIVSQGAGQGVLTSWAVQSQAQLRNRYGADTAEAIWSATRCKVIFGGLADGPALDSLSRMIGDHRVPTRSWSTDPDGKRCETRGHEWRPRLSPAELRGLPPKWALLLYHHRKPYALRAPVAGKRWRFRRALQPAVAARPVAAPIVTMPVRPTLSTPGPATGGLDGWPDVRPRVVHLEEPTPATTGTGSNGEAEVE